MQIKTRVLIQGNLINGDGGLECTMEPSASGADVTDSFVNEVDPGQDRPLRKVFVWMKVSAAWLLELPNLKDARHSMSLGRYCTEAKTIILACQTPVQRTVTETNRRKTQLTIRAAGHPQRRSPRLDGRIEHIQNGQHMDGDVWDAMVHECHNQFPLQPLAKARGAWSQEVNGMARSDVNQARRLVQHADVTDDVAFLYSDVYGAILKAYSGDYCADYVNDDTYVQDAFQPLLKTYFPNDDAICREGANGTTDASRCRKQKFEPDAHDRKGGCSVKTNDGCLSQSVLLVEVKPPKNVASKDLVKLGKCLKDVIDKIDEDGVRDAVVCGPLAEGYGCRAFAMHLKFHGLYLMNILRDVVIRDAKHIKMRIGKRASPSIMTLASFESPIRINEEQKRCLLNNLKGDTKRAIRKLN
ncbi:hypothetical protein BCR43DRAFT_519586 [Syncephalastrum racemosum]|uniref:Uncharacterized protein n=1 Tax=Syncephalastrum racemosum TaxID=13706 RepID=A0A1X2HRL7_SYNRA|nr:hypothetical protein BCR43DRAFT_519586 [Syncephalastrum racemosum]